MATTTTDPVTASLEGVDPRLAAAVAALIAASHGRITVSSGRRTHDQQAKLYNDLGPRLAAPPGHSNHEKGLAVDLGGDTALIAQLAPQFGLIAPMSWEPWHVELPDTRSTASAAAYTPSPSGDANPTVDPLIPASPEFMLASAANSMRELTGLGPDTASAVAEQTGPLVAVNSPSPITTGTDTTTGAPGTAQTATPFTPTPGHATGQGMTGGSGQWNITTWAHDFLTAGGGFPATAENMKAIQAWAQAEGGIQNNNPLNTTQGGYAGHTINSVGVMNYNSYDDSIKANLKALNNGYYTPIIAALHQGNDAMAVARAIAETPWGTGTGVQRVLGGQ